MGLSFAIPIDVAMNIQQQLRTTGKVTRGRIGVGIQPVTKEMAESFGLPKPAGALVNAVQAGSPAEKAGIAPGDEAVAMDGLRLTAENLDSRLRDHHEGDAVTITVFRDHNLMRRRVTLAAPPQDTCYLVIDTDVDAAVESGRKRWLGRP